ncbi:MAG: hypothetical protein JSU87_11855 [Gemmatimonadota bacterium]|nr:MAG: hypothetical protein JSU87_11855 [Gemmatimonadota bacterium]
MIVILNPAAGGGRARERWDKMESRVRQLVGPLDVVTLEGGATVDHLVGAALRRGERHFIAAGGDGTVNLVVSALLRQAPRGVLENLRLGAVGLGSSNDFHKPLSMERQIEDVPIKLDFRVIVRHDVCMLTYRDETGGLHSRRWVINASVGTTAEANHFFNHPNGMLRLMKRHLPSCAMAYAALRTIVSYKARKMIITLDEADTVYTRVKNLGIVKNPHFTGSLSYDSPYEPGGGHFYVHLLRRVSTLRLLLTLLGLLRGKFNGRKGTRSWRATRVRIESEEPFAVEGDGEVVMARRAYFSIVPNLLQVCT